MGDPAPLRRRTHGGAGARALALVKPLPPKAVAGRPGFTRAKRPWLQSPPADRWAAIQDLALARSLLPGRSITHSKFNRARNIIQELKILASISSIVFALETAVSIKTQCGVGIFCIFCVTSIFV